ncbi:uncharacterized protein LOC106664299 [Cimex lectularius]|uniref:Uncharacterized protein n=1 Tax=Cimex lectularius TaxID=79782 RepID=A0A8I6TD30_CIMLE|nr:uncharacterized protein LOC106664299 [Cimex lectularius]
MITKVLSFFLINFTIHSATCWASETEIDELWGDEGSNLTLPCRKDELSHPGDTYWSFNNKHKGLKSSVRHDNTLILKYLSRTDAGEYSCIQDSDMSVINKVRVHVRTPPPPLTNVTVVPSTILALLHWEVVDTGGYPITSFTAQYRLRHTPQGESPDPWHLVMPDGQIKPTATQVDIFQLKPNSSYVFQIWANNKLGRGDVVELEAQTKHDSQEIELGKHLLEGVETFDTRIWIAAVAVVMGTLLILATATIYALYKECHLPLVSEKDMETMELIPNIILNPGYHDYMQSEWSEPDENSNDTMTMRLNNNTVINPVRI